MIGIREIYYRLKYGIFNLIYYFNVIWNDRHWDHYYLYLLLKRKLEGMERFYREKANHEGSEKDSKKMRFCVDCLERLIKDDYVDPENKLREKYGKYVMKCVLDEKGRNVFEMNREKVKTKEEKERYDEELRERCSRGYYEEQRDIRLLFKVIEMNIQRWWD